MVRAKVKLFGRALFPVAAGVADLDGVFGRRRREEVVEHVGSRRVAVYAAVNAVNAPRVGAEVDRGAARD
jgi:hypothetical protein